MFKHLVINQWLTQLFLLRFLLCKWGRLMFLMRSFVMVFVCFWPTFVWLSVIVLRVWPCASIYCCCFLLLWTPADFTREHHHHHGHNNTHTIWLQLELHYTTTLYHCFLFSLRNSGLILAIWAIYFRDLSPFFY